MGYSRKNAFARAVKSLLDENPNTVPRSVDSWWRLNATKNRRNESLENRASRIFHQARFINSSIFSDDADLPLRIWMIASDCSGSVREWHMSERCARSSKDDQGSWKCVWIGRCDRTLVD